MPDPKPDPLSRRTFLAAGVVAATAASGAVPAAAAAGSADGPLRGKVAVVTGAALAQAGADIVGIDILFANAGIQSFKPLLEMEDADWHTQINNNLNGTANAIRAFGPYLVKRGSGRIMVTSSTQGQRGTLNGSAYSAGRWGIIGLMKSAALEFAPHGITVNALVPRLIDMPLTRHEERYAQVLRAAGRQPTGAPAADEEEARKVLTAETPLRGTLDGMMRHCNLANEKKERPRQRTRRNDVEGTPSACFAKRHLI